LHTSASAEAATIGGEPRQVKGFRILPPFFVLPPLAVMTPKKIHPMLIPILPRRRRAAIMQMNPQRGVGAKPPSPERLRSR